MDLSLLGFIRGMQADRIIEHLQTQQHLWPHQSLGTIVTRAQEALGFCPRAGERAISTLKLDPERKIGRLKQCELTQLARTIYRLWLQSTSIQPQTQSA
jgi:hypothetical protein